MDMYFVFMFMTMYMNKIMILEQYRIFQYHFRMAEVDYFLILAEYKSSKKL